MEKNLGHATAYGYAKSKGYSGTEEEFAELMANYASVGQSAAQSAEQAAASATSASGSAATATSAAQTATNKAEDAIIAEGVATAKAEDAQVYATSAVQSAETATSKASEATTAAATATTKASEAGESATTASTAKTDAETARDAAAQSASEAAASAESIDPDEFDRKIYAAFATDTATGAVANFPDGADSIPMKDVLVHIEPVQEGSGDPSPENVRPITGWTGAKVTRAGKNLWMFNDSYSASGYKWILDHVPFSLYPGTYTFSAVPNMEADSVVLFGHHEDGTRTEIGRLQASTTRSSSTNTVSKPIVSLSLVTNVSGTISDIQLELGSIATDYEPYHADTYDITFPSEAGTVYGGTLDVTKGELVVDRSIIASYAGETLPSTWISDRDVYSAGATPTTGAQVCYNLAAPVTYHLTPQEITSLLGTNNLWANTGDSEVEYRADTKLYITKKITEAVNALS